MRVDVSRSVSALNFYVGKRYRLRGGWVEENRIIVRHRPPELGRKASSRFFRILLGPFSAAHWPMSAARRNHAPGGALVPSVRGLAVLVSILAVGVVLLPPAAIARDLKARNAFIRANPCPSTGKPRGPRPGWVVDHI